MNHSAIYNEYFELYRYCLSAPCSGLVQRVPHYLSLVFFVEMLFKFRLILMLTLGVESNTTQERKSCRQNVAIQAIMQKRASKKTMPHNAQTTAPPVEKEVTILTAQQNKKQKSDVRIGR